MVSRPARSIRPLPAHRTLGAAFALAALSLAAFAARAEPYRLVDLGDGIGVGADERGQVAGYTTVSGPRLQAMRWRTGQALALADDGRDSYAAAVAPDGSTAGYVLDDTGGARAVRWKPDGSRVDLGVRGQATGITASGTTIGFTLDADYGYHAWRIDAQGAMASLPPVAGGTQSLANHVNQHGDATGTSWDAQGRGHCLVWKVDGTTVDIGRPDGILTCAAYGINNLGHVIGQVVGHDGYGHAFLWRDGQFTVFGTLGGHGSRAVAVNDDDVVLGEAQHSPDHKGYHPVVWKDGVITDLKKAYDHSGAVFLQTPLGVDRLGRLTFVARSVLRLHEVRVVRLVPTGE